MTTPLRLLQLSDVHFGARMTGGRLGLGESVARRRETEKREAFARALALVAEQALDGVLLPGDLFDDEAVTTDTLYFVLETLGTIAPRPVFLAPGNHDPYGGASPYNPLARGAARGLNWPDNVVLFAHREFRTVGWPGRPDVTVTGCGVAANDASPERRLAQWIARGRSAPAADAPAQLAAPEAELPLLLFHGSRDDGGWLQAHKSTYPFTRDELLAQRFAWAALGHYHGFQEVHDDAGHPVAAYAGCLVASGLDETGEKGCCIVTVGDGPARVERVVLDPRQVRRAVCDLTGSRHAQDARERVERVLREAGASRQDLVHLTLTGRRASGLDLWFVSELTREYFHMNVDLSALLPEVDLDAYPDLAEASTTEQRFVAHLRPLLAGEDAAQARIARRALLYGLDVLARGRLDTRYEQ